MKYLSVFENEAAYTSAKAGSDFNLPHVSLVSSTNVVKFDPIVSE